MALTTIDDRGLKTPIDLLDNEKIRLGTGNDLEIYHTGSQSRIENSGTGELRIQADDIQITDKEANDFHIKCVHDGAVELYHDNVKKLETLSNGARVVDQFFISEGVINLEKAGVHHHRILSNDTGNDLGFQQSSDTGANTNFTTYLRIKDGGDIHLPVDDKKLLLGAGSDLQLYHDGTNSIIDNTPGTGAFYVRGDALYLQTSQSTPENYITMDSGTGPKLFHNNIKCFETNNNGIEVFGPEGGDAIIRLSADERDDDADKWRLHAEADSTQFKIENYNSGTWETSIRAVGDGTVELYFNNDVKLETLTDGLKSKDNTKFCWGDGFDLQIYHNGTDSKIINSTGNLTINATATEPAINIAPNGAVDLYYDNEKVFQTTATGAIIENTNGDGNLTVRGSEGNGALIYLHADDGDDNADKWRLDGSSNGSFGIQNYAQGVWEKSIECNGDGNVELYYDNGKKLETTDYGCAAYTIKPYDDDAHDLGASNIRWDDVYATNGTIQTSDRNAKKDIVKSDLGLTFINAVEPVSYKFKTGTRTHYGVIAQDLETVLDGKDFAGLTKDTETGNYGLRYTELISPLIKAVQELSAEVNTLKTEIAALKAA